MTETRTRIRKLERLYRLLENPDFQKLYKPAWDVLIDDCDVDRLIAAMQNANYWTIPIRTLRVKARKLGVKAPQIFTKIRLIEIIQRKEADVHTILSQCVEPVSVEVHNENSLEQGRSSKDSEAVFPRLFERSSH